MTISSISYSSLRCIDGCGCNQSGSGSYPCVTSGSAVTVIPHSRHWLLPPEASTAPIVNALSLWSRKGIGFVLVLLADITSWRGMARIFVCPYHVNMYNCISIYTVLFYLYCCFISIPQPCLYPITTPYTTVAPVVPECDSLNVNLSH